MQKLDSKVENSNVAEESQMFKRPYLQLPVSRIQSLEKTNQNIYCLTSIGPPGRGYCIFPNSSDICCYVESNGSLLCVCCRFMTPDVQLFVNCSSTFRQLLVGSLSEFRHLFELSSNVRPIYSFASNARPSFVEFCSKVPKQFKSNRRKKLPLHST